MILYILVVIKYGSILYMNIICIETYISYNYLYINIIKLY